MSVEIYTILPKYASQSNQLIFVTKAFNILLATRSIVASADSIKEAIQIHKLCDMHTVIIILNSSQPTA